MIARKLYGHHWRPISLWRIAIAESRGAVQWWFDPRLRRACLKARSGQLYDFAHTRAGFFIRVSYAIVD
jgi:hypothetical protein